MDQMTAMRAFVRVVEVGTFTRAAQLLNIPKPTLSKLIQGLEAYLRTKLLNRTTRRVTVTADGAAYYERVARILADVDELDGSMTLSQASPKGLLRVAFLSGAPWRAATPGRTGAESHRGRLLQFGYGAAVCADLRTQ